MLLPLECTTFAVGNDARVIPDTIDSQKASKHFLPGTEGWTSTSTSTFADRLNVSRVRPNPTILNSGDCFGASADGFHRRTPHPSLQRGEGHLTGSNSNPGSP